MEYIQCSHCDKKYAANDKARAFIGREIKCKACGEKFSIIIANTEQTAPPPTEIPQQDSTKENKNNPTQAEPKKDIKQGHKKSHPENPAPNDEKKSRFSKEKIQLYITATLGICLLIAFTFLLMMDDDKVASQTKTPISQVVQEQKTVVPQHEETKKNTTTQTHHKPQIRTRSLACKKEAAKQWLIDSKMIHGKNSNDDYLSLIDQSQEQSEKLRAACDDSTDVQRVLQAATDQRMLAWFESQIKVVEYESFDLPYADIHSDAPKKR